MRPSEVPSPPDRNGSPRCPVRVLASAALQELLHLPQPAAARSRHGAAAPGPVDRKCPQPGVSPSYGQSLGPGIVCSGANPTSRAQRVDHGRVDNTFQRLTRCSDGMLRNPSGGTRAGDEVRNETAGSVAEHTQASPAGPATVGPDDPRYGDLVGRASKRFTGKPDDVRVVCSSEQVVQAVQDAVREQLRVAVRSGGHCLEAFRADPAVRVVIDTSLMTGVEYDPEVVAGRATCSPVGEAVEPS